MNMMPPKMIGLLQFLKRSLREKHQRARFILLHWIIKFVFNYRFATIHSCAFSFANTSHLELGMRLDCIHQGRHVSEMYFTKTKS